MPSNIEIKAILKDRRKVETIVARLSDSEPEILHQHDIFFRCETARLKLRIVSPEHGELIQYERSDVAEVRSSRYLIARTPDPEILSEILTKALGQTGIVRKTRTLYLIGQTRVHLDQVEALGDFLELEVVLRSEQSEIAGKDIATKLLSDLGIDRSQFISEAYTSTSLPARQSRLQTQWSRVSNR
jgi:predicted adenylyl cyclase CyaB